MSARRDSKLCCVNTHDKTRSEADGGCSWWLNLACAHRDGIVCSGREELSQAKYGIPTLPLLTGSEVADYPSATVTYTREGRMSDMCVPLMTELGKKIRILRGHRLKSPFAPQAGVRYDGQ